MPGARHPNAATQVAKKEIDPRLVSTSLFYVAKAYLAEIERTPEAVRVTS